MKIDGFGGSNAGKIHSIGCAQITHIMTLAVDDEVSVYTVQVGYTKRCTRVLIFAPPARRLRFEQLRGVGQPIAPVAPLQSTKKGTGKYGPC